MVEWNRSLNMPMDQTHVTPGQRSTITHHDKGDVSRRGAKVCSCECRYGSGIDRGANRADNHGVYAKYGDSHGDTAENQGPCNDDDDRLPSENET
jgi:hypothetical protein